MLILSVFPGIDLLGRAFEEEMLGACVVRGPDLLWGGDIRNFHPPAGRFDGVIGGPPCQAFSQMSRLARSRGQTVAPNLIPEFERVVGEARPCWFVMENVPSAPYPRIEDYLTESGVFDNRQFGGEQHRERLIVVGFLERAPHVLRGLVEWAAVNGNYQPTVTARGTRWNAEKQRPQSYRTEADLRRACIAQGLPQDYLSDSPFTCEGKMRVVGQAVPLPMGRAIARAVRRAMEV